MAGNLNDMIVTEVHEGKEFQEPEPKHGWTPVKVIDTHSSSGGGSILYIFWKKT